jgi:2',3'-cyclic-nucleotide 2'-phosphodiesterase (5'-nucleotidase family)
LALTLAMRIPSSGAADRATFELQIIHSSDNESAFADPATLEPKVLHYAAIVAGLRRLAPKANSLHLLAGDITLPGPFYRAAGEVGWLGARGLADISVFNALGVAANGIGNHEFDGGIDDFARMLAASSFPFLAVNLDFTGVRPGPGAPAIRIGRDGGSVIENAGKVARSSYVEVGGHKIGLIGRAPADFFNVVADPAKNLPGLEFYGGRDPANNQPRVSAVDQVLEQVRLLTAQGIDKIILLDHAQDYTVDPLSTDKLSGIDVIVAAGSTGFMARPRATGPFNLLRPGDRPGPDYPTRRTDRDGKPVLVVNSDQLYRYVGHLIVAFDRAGHVVRVSDRSGPVPTTTEGVAALARLTGRPVEPSAGVVQTLHAVRETRLVGTLDRVLGQTDAVLNGNRLEVRTRETNLGRLAADATLWHARQRLAGRPIDLALKNGGGIRDSIPRPQITGFTLASALAFNNKMAVVDIDGGQLLAIMENAVSRLPAADGRFPQLAGALVEFDPGKPGVSDQVTLATPSRIRSLRIVREGAAAEALVENGRVVGDLTRSYRLATNDFLLTGGDGYQALKAMAGKATLFDTGEQEVVGRYVAEVLGGRVTFGDPPSEPRIRPVTAP